MNTTINNRIECNEPHANLDSYYGPYKTVEDALKALNTETIAGVTYTKRAIGLTVGIIENREVVEYWFKSGTTDNDLVKKTADAGFPSGVKIATFDKNGGSGVQASLLTDMDGYVVMPTPSVTRSEYNFAGWKLGSTTYQERDEVQVTDNVIFDAQWEKIKYRVSWNDTGTNATITGSVENNSQQPIGTLITLTATPNTGYTFVQWTGLSGDLTSNPISFNLTADTTGISVQTKQDETTYEVVFTYADGVESIKALYRVPGEEEERDFKSGDKLPLNSIVTLTPEYTEGSSYLKWENVPEKGCEIDDKGVLKINSLNEPIKVNLTAKK